MMIRKFRREELEKEPHQVLFKDLYPWAAIEDTPFSSSLVVIEPGGATMLHSHGPAETFIICRGAGTMTVADETSEVSACDVVYLQPGSMHSLRNDSKTEDLVFLSVFWNAPVPPPSPDGLPARTPEPAAPRLILPSPPTSNGPLHVGHLCGPYLMADVMRRYYRSRGIPATVACLTDEHQSYVVGRARMDGRSVQETATRYSREAVATLTEFGAEPDVCIFPSHDQEYQAAVRTNFSKLLAAGFLEAREAGTLACEKCDRILSDGFVLGNCPHCGTVSNGFICGTCCLPNATVDLKAAVCRDCGEAPAIRKTRRLFFPLQPFARRLAEYHRQIPLSPKLKSLAARMLALPDLAPAASEVSGWGIGLDREGFSGQVISPWFEVALSGPHLRARFAPGSEVVHFFGYDNAYLYLLHDPAVSLALDPNAPLPTGLGANEYLLLNDLKMSTSSQHSLDAREVLAELPADLLRISLARVRPESAPTTWSSTDATHRLNAEVIEYWQSWLAALGQSLAAEAGSRAPKPEAWSPEQSELVAQLETILERAKRGYESYSLTEVYLAIHELVHRAIGFSRSERHLAKIASLAAQRMTALALELASVRMLAVIVAPLMPSFGAQLWKYLGYEGAVEWSDRVRLVPFGQPISTVELSAGRLFPSIKLSDAIDR